LYFISFPYSEVIISLLIDYFDVVAKTIEFGLARLIPLVIGLLANLIGLGGLSKKVMKIFKKIRKRVDKAVNKLLAKAKKAARKIMAKLKRGKKGSAKKIKEENKKGKPEKLTQKDISEHGRIAGTIVSQLEKSSKKSNDESFAEFSKNKKDEAQKLEDKYQPSLKKGINLEIKFESPKIDEKDNDVDFEVIIAPNTTKKKGNSNFGPKMTPSMVEHWKNATKEGKLITNGEYPLKDKETFEAFKEIQRFMNDHHKGNEGDRSVAYAALVEQYIGGPGGKPVPFIRGTRHVDKAKNELKFFEAASKNQNFPDEILDNLKTYVKKLKEAVDWIVKMEGKKVGDDPVTLPSWAGAYSTEIEGKRQKHLKNPEIAENELLARQQGNQDKKERARISREKAEEMKEKRRLAQEKIAREKEERKKNKS